MAPWAGRRCWCNYFGSAAEVVGNNMLTGYSVSQGIKRIPDSCLEQSAPLSACNWAVERWCTKITRLGFEILFLSPVGQYWEYCLKWELFCCKSLVAASSRLTVVSQCCSRFVLKSCQRNRWLFNENHISELCVSVILLKHPESQVMSSPHQQHSAAGVGTTMAILIPSHPQRKWLFANVLHQMCQ